MHVLHIIDTLGLGGAERMLVDIANATVRDGHEVTVCVTRSNTALASELDQKIVLVVLDRRYKFSLVASARLAHYARRADVLHVHMRHTLAYVLLLRALRTLKTPIVFHDHYGTIEIDTSVPWWFRAGHSFIDQYVGVYEKLSLWAQHAGIPASRTTTIPNALDLTRLRSACRAEVRTELKISQSVPLGLLVATLRHDKGIEVLIDAVARSRHRNRIKIAIAGATGDEAYAAELRAAVEAHGLGTTIEFLGPRSDVPAILRDADFGLLSSHTESGPLVLIEYLAAGLPIVSTLVGDIGRRLAADGVEGFVPARNAVAFANALDSLVDQSKDAMQARGMAGRAVLDATWDIRNTMPRWYQLYGVVASPLGSRRG